MAGIVIVRDVMSKDLRVVRPDTSVREVVATLNKFDIGSIVVVQSERPVGIITERDILRKVLGASLVPEALTARQIMTSPVITIDQSASIDEAAALMARKKVKKLLATDGEKIAGMLTLTDIVAKVPKMLSTLEELVRPSRRVY